METPVMALAYAMNGYAMLLAAFLVIDAVFIRACMAVTGILANSLPPKRVTPTFETKGPVGRKRGIGSFITEDGRTFGQKLLCADLQQCALGSENAGQRVLEDSLIFMKSGVEAIIEDNVTIRFAAAELPSWNLLTRNSPPHTQFSWKLHALWACGLWFRYAVMFPLRVCLASAALSLFACATALIACLPEKSRTKVYLQRSLLPFCYKAMSKALSARIHFYNEENRSGEGGICVSNHTSPLDVCILSTNCAYALTGQRHGGFLGWLQWVISAAGSHIWFERSEGKDRARVASRLRAHIKDVEKPPILVFPEGTCINNTSVMLFKKGAFEVSPRIYPIAMKYDTRFGDAFWNSSVENYIQYLLRLLTSWAIVCHVWYLPAMERKPNETAIDFANRVKLAIALRAGLEDLEWDGDLKRSKVRPESVAKAKKKYSQALLLRLVDDGEEKEKYSTDSGAHQTAGAMIADM